MRCVTAEKTTEIEPGILWFEIPFYICKKCKQGCYDVRAHVMEDVAITWIHEPDEDRTWH